MQFDCNNLGTGFSGYQFPNVSEGNHTVTVESISTNGLTTASTSRTITVRGKNAIVITDICREL